MKQDELIEAMMFARARYVMGCMGGHLRPRFDLYAALRRAREALKGQSDD
jgi:hypothetical protein